MAISVITISCEHSDATVGDEEQSGERQDPGITPSKKRVCGCMVTDSSDLDPGCYL